MSHYDTLGVDKAASQDDIKKAYRKLAKEYHPDKSGGDDTKFKLVAEAYDIVGDSNKRQAYDMRGSGADMFGQYHDSNVNLSDIFDQMFGGAQQQQSKGLDVRIELHISFKEAMEGCDKRFSVNGRDMNVNFKPGIKTGQKFRLKGKGQPHPYNSNLPSGDLVVHANVQHDLNFILQGDDLWVEHNLPWYEIMIGCKIEVLTPEGRISINVPPGSYPGKTLRIKDKGFPIYGKNSRGALLCRLNAVYPELNEESLEYIDKIKYSQRDTNE
jgi:curved DNA-binding protein